MTSTTCTVCGDRFTTAVKLAKHIQAEHGEDTMEDEKIGQQMSQNKSKNKRGKKQLLFECFYCDSRFKSFPALKRHQQTHADSKNKKKKPIECRYCNAMFTNASAKMAHEKAHGKGDPTRCFRCDLCNRSFPTSSQLNRHEVTHNAAKAYRCTICQRPMSRKDHLRTHLQKQHNITDPDELKRLQNTGKVSDFDHLPKPKGSWSSVSSSSASLLDIPTPQFSDYGSGSDGGDVFRKKARTVKDEGGEIPLSFVASAEVQSSFFANVNRLQREWSSNRRSVSDLDFSSCQWLSEEQEQSPSDTTASDQQSLSAKEKELMHQSPLYQLLAQAERDGMKMPEPSQFPHFAKALRRLIDRFPKNNTHRNNSTSSTVSRPPASPQAPVTAAPSDLDNLMDVCTDDFSMPLLMHSAAPGDSTSSSLLMLPPTQPLTSEPLASITTNSIFANAINNVGGGDHMMGCGVAAVNFDGAMYPKAAALDISYSPPIGIESSDFALLTDFSEIWTET